MIDCGRKFIPMSYLQDLVKIMAYYKMNTLQVHLNDNGFKQYFDNNWDKTYAAFRLESETYPGLTARDGSYSKKEFIDFQKQAATNFVEIIPEIDIPAHSLAFTHYKPEIGSKEYGMDHLDLFKPETYQFADNLFKEYLKGDDPVFVGKRVHIGTDEYSNAKKEVVEKFRAFTDHYIRLVEGFGKQAVIWGALTHAKGDTPVKSENIIMNAWYNGYADPAEACSSLSAEQQERLWLLLLCDGISALEFDYVLSAFQEGRLNSLFSWELSLRMALDKAHVKISYEENNFHITRSDGSRILYDYAGGSAAEKLFLKILFPAIPSRH